MRAWLAIILIVLGIAAARALPVDQQIIIFGTQSSASGSGGGGGSCLPGAPTGQMDFSVCSNIAITAALP